MVDNLNMTATVTDNATGPLKDISNAVNKLSDSSEKGLKGVEKAGHELGKSLHDLVGALGPLTNVFAPASPLLSGVFRATNAMTVLHESLQTAKVGGFTAAIAETGVVIGIMSAAAGVAAIALGKMVEGFAKDQIALKYFSEETKLSIGLIQQFQDVGSLVGIPQEKINAGLKTFSSMMLGIKFQTKEAIDLQNFLARSGAPDIYDRLKSLSGMKNYDEAAREALKIIREQQDPQIQGYLSKYFFGSEDFGRVGRRWDEFLNTLPKKVQLDTEAMEAFEKQVLIAERNMWNLGATIAEKSAPALAGLTKGLNDWYEAHKPDVDKAFLDFFDEGAKRAKTTVDEFNKIKEFFEWLEVKLAFLKGAWNWGSKVHDAVTKELAEKQQTIEPESAEEKTRSWGHRLLDWNRRQAEAEQRAAEARRAQGLAGEQQPKAPPDTAQAPGFLQRINPFGQSLLPHRKPTAWEEHRKRTPWEEHLLNRFNAPSEQPVGTAPAPAPVPSEAPPKGAAAPAGFIPAAFTTTMPSDVLRALHPPEQTPPGQPIILPEALHRAMMQGAVPEAPQAREQENVDFPDLSERWRTGEMGAGRPGEFKSEYELPAELQSFLDRMASIRPGQFKSEPETTAGYTVTQPWHTPEGGPRPQAPEEQRRASGFQQAGFNEILGEAPEIFKFLKNRTPTAGLLMKIPGLFGGGTEIGPQLLQGNPAERAAELKKWIELQKLEGKRLPLSEEEIWKIYRLSPQDIGAAIGGRGGTGGWESRQTPEMPPKMQAPSAEMVPERFQDRVPEEMWNRPVLGPQHENIDRALRSETNIHRIEGAATLDINVNGSGPIETRTKTSGDLFSDVKLNRSGQLTQAADWLT
jgi:hypothetical protein